MSEFITGVIVAVIAWVAGRHIQFSHSRLERTLRLLSEFHTDEMQNHRYALWLRRKTLFTTHNFNTQLQSVNPDEFGPSHVLFHFISFANFWRRLADYARLNQIDREECRKLLGPLYSLYWREIFEPAMRGYKRGDDHYLLWDVLRTLDWLREGFDDPLNRVTYCGEVDREDRAASLAK